MEASHSVDPEWRRARDTAWKLGGEELVMCWMQPPLGEVLDIFQPYGENTAPGREE
jgi:hypothetical protein